MINLEEHKFTTLKGDLAEFYNLLTSLSLDVRPVFTALYAINLGV